MILRSEKMLLKTNFDLRIPLNWTMIRDNDVSGCRLETERRSESHIYTFVSLQQFF